MHVKQVENGHDTVVEIFSKTVSPINKPNDDLILVERINNKPEEKPKTSPEKQRRNPLRRARFSGNSDLILRGHALEKDLKFLDGPIKDEKVLA